MSSKKSIMSALFVTASIVAFPAFSDTIDPTTFEAELAVGESVTIEKTVVILATGPTDALIDVHFLIDTSGSMGSEIAAAKDAAGDLFDSLEADFGVGNVNAGVGAFAEQANLAPLPASNANVIIGSGLTTDKTTFDNTVGLVTLNVPDNGGDAPESGYDAIALAGDNLDWRAGSNRFMFVFTDNVAKGDLLAAQTALAANDISLVTLSYGNFAAIDASYGAPLGGTTYASSTSAADIIDDVTAGIIADFAEYSEVTVGDLGAGLPEIGVSAVCTGADIGACVAESAIGDYDRSVDRTFTFDVTFERVAEGDKDFTTFALVDGGAVARELDSFPAAKVPVPAALPLMLSAFGALAIARRRRRKA